MAVTTDLSIEGRHFRLEWHSPESIGHRTLARGLSDLAAMGARPVAAFLSLGLPRSLTVRGRRKDRGAWVDRFFDGLMGLAAEFGVELAGGDLAEAPVALADIVLVGAVPAGTALLRSGARAGDRIFVTGVLGGSAAELKVLGEKPRQFAGLTRAALTGRGGGSHLFPLPRIAQGAWLRKHGIATAAMDLSDGLSTDLRHLCEASHVGAEVDASLLPLGRTIAGPATVEQALHGGEDYELLFTAPAGVRVPRRIGGVPITEIGRIDSARKGRARLRLLVDGEASELEPRGWEHFSG